jgi:hypothetical protein
MEDLPLEEKLLLVAAVQQARRPGNRLPGWIHCVRICVCSGFYFNTPKASIL